MNLYSRLKAEVSVELEMDKEKFPNIHSAIVRDLSVNDFVTDIPLGTAQSILDYYLAGGGKLRNDSFMLNIYDLFEPNI